MVQAVTIPSGVVSISDSATAPSISALDDNDLVFRVAASDAYQGVALAELAMERGFETVAVTYANDDYNAGLAAAFVEAYEEMGGEVVANQAHEPEKASYRAEAATLGGAGADALAIFAYYGSSGITIIRNMLELGLMDTFMGADGMVHEQLIAAIGAENLQKAYFTTAASDESTNAFQSFEAEAEANDVKPSAPYVAHGYDATFLLALAIEQAGADERGLVSDALREVANAPGEVIIPGEWEKAKRLIAEGTDINYIGATGEIEFDENGDVAGLYSVNTVSEDGTWETELLK
jgi:branched-chain amino acid transport system substrate-binding protein